MACLPDLRAASRDYEQRQAERLRATATDECHGPVPWIVTLVSTPRTVRSCGCHGLVPWRFTFLLWKASSEREAPRHKAVASRRGSPLFVETNAINHGTRPWHS